MPPKKRFVTCEICGNRAKRIGDKKRKFMAKFPLEEARCRDWVKAVGKEDLIHVPIEKLHSLKYVCGNHFENKAFNKQKNRLRKSAIPSINLKASPLSDELLVEFPSHIRSTIDMTKTYSSQDICSNQATSSQVEAIAGSSKSDPVHSVDELTEEKYQSHIRKQSLTSEPSTSKQPYYKLDHDYCAINMKSCQTPKREKASISDLEVTPRKRKLMRKVEC